MQWNRIMKNDTTVLVVDDNPENLKVLGNLLRDNGYSPVIAKTGTMALEYLKKEKPSLVLLDIMMPEMDGYETCRRMVNDPNTRDIPVIFLSAKNNPDDIVKGFEAGGVDYVSKPFQNSEILARIGTHVKLQKMRIQLEEKNALLAEQAIKDFLTGLFNRRYFIEQFERDLSRAKRYGRDLTLMMLDIDHFKSINDSYGHAVGDEVLKMLGSIGKEFVRNTDVFARIGGEEFAVILTETNISGGRAIAERFREKIQGISVPARTGAARFTVSIGLAQALNDDATIDGIMKNADDALYHAKHNGRNRVEIFHAQ